MNTPCQDRIEMAVRSTARAILRRWFEGPQTARATADEYLWLKRNLPEVVTDSALERALRLAGPAFDKACNHFISQFYLPTENNRVRDLVLAALAEEGGVA